MAHVEVKDLRYVLPDARVLLDDVSFRVGEGSVAALVGPNGAGKTTLLALIAGDVRPTAGSVTTSGGLGVMRQFVEGDRDGATVRDVLLSVAPGRVRAAAARLAGAEAAAGGDDAASGMELAEALAEYQEAGGYELEVVWDACTTAALGAGLRDVEHRAIGTLSGGEQKRLVLEALLRGPDEVLLLDEPDNYLDVPGKEWLEGQLRATTKTVLLVSHDRQLLAGAAERIVVVEDRTAWVHGGGFATLAEARRDRNDRLGDRRRRWDEEHRRLRTVVDEQRRRAQRSAAAASGHRAARNRLERFEAAGPPRGRPREQNIRMRLRGARTGTRAVVCEGLEVPGLLQPFDLEVTYGDRVAVLGANGSGKSQFLALLAELGGGRDGTVPHGGRVLFGANVRAGHFAQTHVRPDLEGRSIAEIVMEDHHLERNDAMSALARYELAPAWQQPFTALSGGQQARLQILLLELAGSTLLLLDEPIDNLDLASADALQAGLRDFAGSVLAVTHDRWFAAEFDRFLLFTADGKVRETAEPVWDGDA